MALEEMAISTLSSPSAMPSRTVVCSMMRLSAPNWASIWPALTMIRVISVCCSRDSTLPGVMLLMIPLSHSKMKCVWILPQNKYTFIHLYRTAGTGHYYSAARGIFAANKKQFTQLA
jgi:hypothetical protein